MALNDLVSGRDVVYFFFAQKMSLSDSAAPAGEQRRTRTRVPQPPTSMYVALANADASSLPVSLLFS